MEKRIKLPQETRTFEMTGTDTYLLARTGRYIAAGTELTIGDPIVVGYDHHDQVAVPIVEGDVDGIYLLLQEIGLPELTN